MNYLQLVLFLLYIYKILSSSVDFIQIITTFVYCSHLKRIIYDQKNDTRCLVSGSHSGS